MKRHKNPVRSPASNGDAQVFVLPPDLLQQLGIKLTNITFPGGLAENSIVDQSAKDNTEDILSNVDAGSSILETANLMKQSVFMSPTFLSTTATETPSQLNICNIVTDTEESIPDKNKPRVVNKLANVDNAVKIKFSNSDTNPSNFENFEMYQTINEYEVENETGDLILTKLNVSCNNTNIDVNGLKKTSHSADDDHADEAYLSDGSNSNCGTITESTNNNSEADKNPQKFNNKIEILSEQIINHSVLNTFSNSHIQKNNSCFLIPVNTIVTGKTTKDRSNNQLEKKIKKRVQEELCTTIEVNDKVGKVDITNNIEHVIEKVTVVKDLLRVIDPGSIVPGVIKEEIIKIPDTDSHILANNDENKSIDFKDFSKDVKPKSKTVHDNAKEIFSNSEKSSSKSKLCIQGVEKPGGTLKFKIGAVLKTYQKTNKRKFIPELMHTDNTNIVDCSILPKDVIDLHDININGYNNANKFCICSDFGQLANYDSDISYEHIHFCNHNNVGCNLETLFSIYNDSSLLRELNATEDIDMLNDVETIQHSICWLNFISENKNETEESAVYESKIMDQSNSITDQPRRSNRKRKSTATEHVTESIEPKSKKTTKCGACGLILSETEWNKHKDSEHNLIAWKDGETIDLNNKQLLKTLRLKLKRLGVLKCTFCKTDIKYLTKFIQHVKKCINLKIQNMSNKTEGETLPDALEKDDTTPKLTHQTRRSSRNCNLRSDLSEFSADNTSIPKVNHGHVAFSKKVQKSTNVETDIPSKSKKSASSEQIETPTISKNKSIKNTSNLVEMDGVNFKSTRSTSTDVTRKASDFEDSSKLISVVSCSKPKKSLNVERPTRCTKQSKTFEGTTKSTVFEVTLKSTETKNTPKTLVQKALKLTTKINDNCPKATKFKDNTATKFKDNTKVEIVSPKSKRTTNQVTATVTDITTPKAEIKASPKLISDSIDIEVKTKSNLALANEATSKITRKLIDDARHPNLPPNANDSIESSNKTKINTGEASEKFTAQNPKNIETFSTSTRKLKEIDLFSSPTMNKISNIKGQLKSIKKSKVNTALPKQVNVEEGPKSAVCSTDVSSKRIRKSLNHKDSNKLKRKSIDVEAPSNINNKNVNAETNGDEVDISSMSTSSKILRKYTHKSSKKVIEVVSPSQTNEIKNVDTPPKYQCLSSKSTKTSSDLTKSKTVSNAEKVTIPKSRRKSNIEDIQVQVNSPQKHGSVEIDIPAHSAKTATADNGTTSKNTQGAIDASSSSNGGNNVAHSSSEINSIITSDDPNESQPVDEIFVVSIKEEILPICGVCKQQVDESQWLEHIAKEHCYLAWREGEQPLDLEDEEVVRSHLYDITKANGGLKCYKCNLIRKYVKSYLTHIQNCIGDEEQESQMDVSTASGIDTTQDLDDLPLQLYPRAIVRNAQCQQQSVVCGVCSETVLENKWIDHIRMEHKYLAWKSGEPPLDVEDEAEVKFFLKSISNKYGGLICSKCGAIRSYVKKWMDHEATCKGNEACESSESGNTLSESKVSAQLIEIEVLTHNIKCAKCSKEMKSESWIDHIEKEHNYLSWIEGHPPLDESNPEAVSAYLFAMVRKRGTLCCVKCGVTRKYPKAFLTHIAACENSGFKREDFFVEVSGIAKQGEYECAVCHETGNRKDWKKHAMEKHYNVAWMAGDIPINLKNPYAVEKYIKEYRVKHNLICKVCGASRASCYGFYAHILTCGKSEAELEHLMDMCDICNNKFLCIYRNQHKAMHREQVRTKEKKERNAIKAEEESIAKAKSEEGQSTGKRRAAEKAKKVMENYTSNIQDGSNVCLSCHIEFDSETQLKDHVCQGSKLDDASDSDVSVKIEQQEESEDDMEGVDSNISDEEEDPLKRKRQSDAPIPKIVLPFKVKDFNYYLAKSYENFCELHYTSDSLFNNWRSEDFMILSEDESDKYLPLLQESCKLRFLEDEWETYKRFEARKKRDMAIFTGATVRCMQWVPQCLAEEQQDQYLSVSCFRDADCPRSGKDELHEHPGMLQIWNIGRFTSIPKFELGVAHDFGTIWAMDWCPSGARDPEETESEGSARLGLLAIACSNGCAYVLSVPRLHTETQNKPIICKLKPVAELRFSINTKQHPFKVGYQATAISWSPQKGHEVVMVGYADGTTALYDLNTESSFLKTTENGVDIFYPFQDALSENSTITGVALCASGDLRLAVGGRASASVTGATMASGARGAAVRSHLAAGGVAYTPSWPAALLCSDDVLTMKSTNEMEWWGGGRRLGGACAAGSCARCGRLCLAAPPFVRVLRHHPCYPELKKQIVATMKMVPIASKRKFKLVNDDLGMIVEPLTYDETIKKYGLEFKTLPKKEQNVASKLCDNVEQRAERFPLSDMPAAAFCPSAAHHARLAVASHAGFLFIISS